MPVQKYQINFLLESRKDKSSGELTKVNVPIFMCVTYSGQRLWYYTGYRIDRDQWVNKSKTGDKVQRAIKNTVNGDGVSAAIINSRLIELEATVNSIFLENGMVMPSRSKLPEILKGGLGEEKKHGPKGFYEYFDKYNKDAKVSSGRRAHLKSTKTHLNNYCSNLTFEKCTPTFLREFENYLSSDEDNPRSRNTISGIMSRVRAFFSYAVSEDWTKTNPFKEFGIEQEKYGEPIYLTKEERDILFDAKLENERLSRVRDMFVLQCFIGCRVGDFVKLKRSNIINGSIHYVPQKTQDENEKVCRIPLSEKAWTIINKYDLPDGSLVPYISDQRYNEYIRELFRECKLTRSVLRLNPITRKNEVKSIADIASSHMARRTFIGLLHKTVKNEVIASMSGHAENSRAFHRYYKVDEESQIDAIKTIE